MNSYRITASARQMPNVLADPKHSKKQLFLLTGNKGRKLRAIPVETESHTRMKNERDQPIHSLSGLLLKTQEEERSRIARELHDDVAQRVVLLCLKINELRLANENMKLVPQLDYLAEESRSLGDCVRDLSHQLHSHQLD